MSESIEGKNLPAGPRIGIDIAGLGLAGSHHVDVARRLGPHSRTGSASTASWMQS